MTRLLLLVGLMLLSMSALAIDEGKAFDDPELQARYDKLVEEIRCLKCQNQSIKDSNAFLAGDLRREVRRMIDEGMSDGEIADFLVDRYGEFALYRPRMSGKTLFLWIAPFALLLLGAFALFRVIRHRIALPVNDDETGEN
jgi:cytochrome c-type biogenesis protein CcmH